MAIPTAPDFTKLTEQNADASKAATDAQTAANRPNQTDPYGNTSTWTQDPTTGQWTQKTALGGANQSNYDQYNRVRSGLMGQAVNSLGKPLDMSGLPTVPGYDPSKLQSVNLGGMGGGNFTMDPFGNSKAIQDATYGLLNPQRQLDRSSEIQRLKSQGLTEDSAAFQRAMLRQGQADTDAQLKSLLAGQTEYGNAFTRAKDAYGLNYDQKYKTQELARQLRGDQFGEQSDMIKNTQAQRDAMLKERAAVRGNPLAELTALDKITGFQKPEFSEFANATKAESPDYYDAGTKQYNAATNTYNAQEAAENNRNDEILEWLKLLTG